MHWISLISQFAKGKTYLFVKGIYISCTHFQTCATIAENGVLMHKSTDVLAPGNPGKARTCTYVKCSFKNVTSPPNPGQGNRCFITWKWILTFINNPWTIIYPYQFVRTRKYKTSRIYNTLVLPGHVTSPSYTRPRIGGAVYFDCLDTRITVRRCSRLEYWDYHVTVSFF